jgi:hypothetical protein
MKIKRGRERNKKISYIKNSNSLADEVTMAVAFHPRMEICGGLNMSPGLPHYATLQQGRFPESPSTLAALSTCHSKS